MPRVSLVKPARAYSGKLASRSQASNQKAAELRDQAETKRREKEQIQRTWRDKSKEVSGVVDEEVIAEVVSKMTGVPLKKVGEDETTRGTKHSMGEFENAKSAQSIQARHSHRAEQGNSPTRPH